MPAYRYEALDVDGKAAKGLVEADSAKAARTQLRAQALVPLAVTPVADANTGSTGGTRFTRRVFGTAGLTVWTRQLAGLVGSGLPLERALTALADESEEAKQRELLSHLRSEVNAGSSFARALSTAPREFDEVYRAVVAAGEQSGALGAVLERLADDLEDRQALRAKLLGAMLYPAIVSLIAIVIVTFLVTYVVPQVASVFTSSKRALPALTTGMLALSSFVRNWGWAVALALVGGAVMLSLAAAARPSANAATRSSCACHSSAAWPAATTRRASVARWPCWRGPACPSSRPCRPPPRRWATAPCAPTRWTPWCRCAKARRWPAHWPARSDSRDCFRCLPAWANRPASCR